MSRVSITSIVVVVENNVQTIHRALSLVNPQPNISVNVYHQIIRSIIHVFNEPSPLARGFGCLPSRPLGKK